MFDKILHPSRFNVLVIDFSKNQKINSFIIRKKEYWKITKANNVSSIEEFCKKVRNTYPTIVHCIGKGIINRETESHPNLRDDLTVNGDKADFYFTELHQNRAYVSMTRKDKIDPILNELQRGNHIIYNLSLGPFVLQSLLKSGTITSDFEIELSNSQIVSFSKSMNGSKNIDFKGIELNHYEQYAVAAAQILTLEGEWKYPIAQNVLLTNRKESFEKSKFKIFGIFILSFFLIILISNNFYNRDITNTNADLEAEISIYGSNLSQIEQLDNEINRKKMLVSSSALSSSNYLSYYVDQIAVTIPSQAKLTQLNIYPLEDKLKQKRKVNLNETIILKGEVPSSRVMDNWVLELEKLFWTDKVQILNFSRARNSVSKFEIKIFIKDELV